MFPLFVTTKYPVWLVTPYNVTLNSLFQAEFTNNESLLSFTTILHILLHDVKPAHPAIRESRDSCG